MAKTRLAFFPRNLERVRWTRVANQSRVFSYSGSLQSQSHNAYDLLIKILLLFMIYPNLSV